jgi:hypothetical protein
MSEHSVIVWDLQTVPDLAAAARLFDMEGAAEAEVREALGSGFPKHPLRSSFNPQGRTMVKHADRWPPAYYRAINQLADVIATFPPEKVPPFQLREVTDDLEIALNRRHRADYEALCHAGFAYHCVQERERRRERRRAGARMAAATRARKVAEGRK